jgi:hypothetical protein
MTSVYPERDVAEVRVEGILISTHPFLSWEVLSFEDVIFGAMADTL